MPGPVMRNPAPQWLTDPSVTDSFTTKALRAILTTLGADSPSSQVLGLMSTMVPSAGKTGGLVGKVTEALKGIKAYHGSPHDFDKFSMEKIGTGEGAQAYGHGLYFAETEGTAKAYRDNLTQMRVGAAQRQLQQHGGDINAATTAARSEIDRLKALPNAGGDVARRDGLIAIQEGKLAELKALRDGGSMSKGRMYEVNIKADPESFLDWDAPLAKQPEAVRYVLGHKGRPAEAEVDAMFALAKQRGVAPTALPEYQALQKRLDEAAAVERNYPNGRAVYNEFMNDGRDVAIRQGRNSDTTLPASQSEASRQLRDMGIPGIKYLDQGSRSAGEGSRNYVVFDDSIVDILKKYGLLLPAAGAAMQSHEPTP